MTYLIAPFILSMAFGIIIIFLIFILNQRNYEIEKLKEGNKDKDIDIPKNKVNYFYPEAPSMEVLKEVPKKLWHIKITLKSGKEYSYSNSMVAVPYSFRRVTHWLRTRESEYYNWEYGQGSNRGFGILKLSRSDILSIDVVNKEEGK